MVSRHPAFLILCFILLACMRTSLALADSHAHKNAAPSAVNVFEDSTTEFTDDFSHEDGNSAPIEDEPEETDSSDLDVEDFASLISEFHFQLPPNLKYSPTNEDASSFANDPLTYPP